LAQVLPLVSAAGCGVARFKPGSCAESALSSPHYFFTFSLPYAPGSRRGLFYWPRSLAPSPEAAPLPRGRARPNCDVKLSAMEANCLFDVGKSDHSGRIIQIQMNTRKRDKIAMKAFFSL
jgi:hypothetical protein